VKGVGIDICDIGRIENVIERQGQDFENRVFTDLELEQSGGKAHSLAARWAAKEAFSKAIRTGITGFSYVDVEVIREDSGAPSLKLHGDAQKIFDSLGAGQLHLSLSHEKNMAIAIVIWD
jgi:holo-[acyl-carrier protein] synthase